MFITAFILTKKERHTQAFVRNATEKSALKSEAAEQTTGFLRHRELLPLNSLIFDLFA